MASWVTLDNNHLDCFNISKEKQWEVDGYETGELRV